MGFSSDVIRPSTKEYFVEQMKLSGQWFEDDLVDLKISTDLITLVPKDIVDSFHVVPVALEKVAAGEEGRDKLFLVTNSEQGFKNICVLSTMVGCAVELKMADDENVKRAILRYYGLSLVGNLPLEQIDISRYEKDIQGSDLSERDKSPVVAKVDLLLCSAIDRKVSDIHILPHMDGSFVLFRIDGRLINVSDEYKIDKREKKEVVNIVKNKCEPRLDGAITHLPQDGSFNVGYKGVIVDCRVSTMPTVRGQKVVIRLLPMARKVFNFNDLGFDKRDKFIMEDALAEPSGLFLVVGPTGSGKSTTLHAAVETFGGLVTNTITIEDPVEYKNEFLTQVQVRNTGKEEQRLDAHSILKAVLRQDPDNVLYGEIRNMLDAEVCIQAAQTGHKVLSTIHAKGVVSGLERLFDLGVKRSSLLRELNCIIAQRLVGLLCPQCSVPYEPIISKSLSEADVSFLRSGKPRKVGVGCFFCNGGYSGRTVVNEVVAFDNDLRDFLREERGINETLEKLRNDYAFKTLRERALELVRDGLVDYEEVLRVVGKFG